MTKANSTTLTTTAEFDRSLIWGRGGSVRYMAANVACEAPEADEPRPLNLAFVIDASGSMAGDRIEAAKEAAIRLVDQLEDRDKLSIVAFDSNPTIVAKSVTCDASGRSDLKTRIQDLQAGSMTNLSGGWLLGAECVAASSEVAATLSHVVLLSDGHANEGIVNPRELAHHARELAARGVSSSTVGIGDDYSPVQLNAISDNGGGRTHDAERPHEIAEVVGGELAELRGTVLEDVRMDIWAPDTVKVEVLSAFAVTDSADGVEVRLGSLAAKSSRRVVLRITSGESKPGGSLDFGVEASGREIATGAEITSEEVTARLTFARGRDNSGQPRSEEIAVIVAKEWQGHALRRAIDLNRSGDYHRASEYLLAQLRHFKRYCSGLADGAQLISDFELAARRMGRPIEERSLKEMAMSSRYSSRLEKDYRSFKRPDPREYLKR